MSNFVEWVQEFELDCIADRNNLNLFQILNVGQFLLVSKKPEVLSDELVLVLDKDEQEADVDFYAYEFGGQFYYTSKEKISPPDFNIFRHLGQKKCELDLPFPCLGLHGEYELLNGSRVYSDWVKKAEFLDVKTLGICELNTLAGTLPFQLACKSAKIKSVLGEEVTVKIDDKYQDWKLYVMNKDGWENLLFINAQINVFNEKKYVDYNLLLSHSQGLVLVLPWDYDFHPVRTKELDSKFYLYYQFDTVEWVNEERDRVYLQTQKKYLEKMKPSPVLLNDMYYLDKDDSFVKDALNTISGHKNQGEAKNQYFKSLDDNFHALDRLFSDGDKLFELFELALGNAQSIDGLCNFQIETGKRHLPEFSLKGLDEEYSQFQTNEDLFWYLVEKGLILREIPEEKMGEYIERVEKEYLVIKEGEVIDYFLILWDIMEWCKKNNILVGFGRGSAGGALVAYLLGITNLDPIKFNLLFERFLNVGRVKTSLPDIDCDFQSNRREDVKRYMESRYGDEYVCSVGTYTRLQLKASVKDFGRLKGVDIQILNYINKLLETTATQAENDHWSDLFMNSKEIPAVKEFIKKNPELINDIQLVLGQPRSSSVHACATIILPKIEVEGDKCTTKTLFNLIPIKQVEGVLVSEWEGEYLEKAGYLKEDILGLSQLDKFSEILKLIKESTDQEIDIYKLPYDDKRIFEMFKKGWNSDVFHFGSPGLTTYCIDVKPDTIDDLVAILAVYRPGPMFVKAHIDYVELKHGRKQPVYDFGLREVTKKTYGLYIYQEQIMQAVGVLGGFNLVEADDVRRAMGKMDRALIEKSKIQFTEGATERGCSKEEAEKIWHKLEVFAEYGFNRSHAAAYAVTGYVGQWLKCYYPVQYWTVAFQHAEEKQIPRFISELSRSKSEVSLKPPSINHSGEILRTDFETSTIYWSLLKIKNVGLTSVISILEERVKNGLYYSFEEFLERSNKTVVDKTVVTCLIKAGALDELCKIEEPYQRLEVLSKYYELTKRKPDAILELALKYNVSKYNWWWVFQQRELCGFGYFDFVSIIRDSCKVFKGQELIFVDVDEFYTSGVVDKKVLVGGVLTKFVERVSKRGKFGEITLQCNDDNVICTLWSDTWEKYSKEIQASEGRLIFLTGIVSYDSKYKKINVLQTNKGSKVEILG